MSDKRVFVNCEKCGKRLIERLPNGMWRFIFGKGEDRTDPPVELLIHGNLQIKCLRRSCGHKNILNFFPTFQKED